MARTNVFVSITFAALILQAGTSRDDDHHKDGGKLEGSESYSLRPRNFVRLHADQHNELKLTASEKDQAKSSEEHRSKLNLSAQSSASLANITAVDTSAKTSANETERMMAAEVARTVHAATEDMVSVRDSARELRKSVESLGSELGFDDKAMMKVEAIARQRNEAKHKLREVASEWQRLQSFAESLDTQIQEAHERLSSTELGDSEDRQREIMHNLAMQERLVDEQKSLTNVANKFANNEMTLSEAESEYQRIKARGHEMSMEMRAPGKGIPSPKDQKKEDAQFAKLEQETQNILSWFNQLKKLKQERDSMRAKREEATKAAKNLGLTQEEIANQLKHADKSEQAAPISPSSLAEVSTQRKMNEVMIKSALDMQRIETAADDVMKSLAEFDDWKTRSDDSPQAIAHGMQLKERLQRGIGYLKVSEDVVNHRASQLNALLGRTTDAAQE